MLQVSFAKTASVSMMMIAASAIITGSVVQNDPFRESMIVRDGQGTLHTVS